MTDIAPRQIERGARQNGPAVVRSQARAGGSWSDTTLSLGRAPRACDAASDVWFVEPLQTRVEAEYTFYVPRSEADPAGIAR